MRCPPWYPRHPGLGAVQPVPSEQLLYLSQPSLRKPWEIKPFHCRPFLSTSSPSRGDAGSAKTLHAEPVGHSSSPKQPELLVLSANLHLLGAGERQGWAEHPGGCLHPEAGCSGCWPCVIRAHCCPSQASCCASSPSSCSRAGPSDDGHAVIGAPCPHPLQPHHPHPPASCHCNSILPLSLQMCCPPCGTVPSGDSEG